MRIFYPKISGSLDVTGSTYIIGPVQITGSLNVLNGITGSLFGTASWALNSITASYALESLTSSFSHTASYVNTLNQNVLITGSLTVGAASVGVSENTLTLGPRDSSQEGGQLMLQAPGGAYTSASMWDNYQNQTRLLRGTNAGSDAIVASFNMHTKQMVLPTYNSLGAFSGTPVAALGVNSSGDVITIQTGSQAGGSGTTINNNTDNYILTATGTTNTIQGEANLQFNGSTLSVTGNVTATSITSSGAIIAQANGAMYFRGGDDAEFWDINVANTVGIYGQQNSSSAGLKLGSSGPTLFGSASKFGIGTITPTQATLEVNGNVYATSFTGSLNGTASYALQSLTSSFSHTASYVNILYQNVTISGSLNISGSILNVDSIQFNTGSTVTLTPGGINWDDGTGTLNVLLKGGNIDLQVGQENVVLIYNGESTTLNKGEVVYVSGSVGNRPLVKRASAVNDGYSVTTLGFAAESITAGAEGYVTTFGMINNLNTTASYEGAPVWLSPTVLGGWTTTKPQAPDHTVLLGYIVRVSATVGSIFVHISNGWEIEELHNVRIVNDTAGDILVRSGSLWINSKQLSGSYGLTGSLSATSFTGSLFGTASNANTASHVNTLNQNVLINGTLNVTGAFTASGNIYPTNLGTSGYFLQTDGVGNLSWNYVRSVLESVKNVDSVTLVKGTPVYVSSSVGNTAEVVKADAAIASLMPATYILNETLTVGQQGLGIVLGFINNIDTSLFNESDQVYVNSGGGYTNVQPTGSVLIQPLGTVVRVDNTNGSIMVSNTGVSNNIPNINPGYAWVGNSDWLATPTATSSFFVNSASYAITASYALNVIGGSTDTGSLLVTASAVSNTITFTKGNGTTFDVTVAVGGNATASFTSQPTWVFNHNLGSQLVIVQAVDLNYNQIIPSSITLNGTNQATLTFPVSQSGYAIASLGGNSASSGGSGAGFPFSGSAEITGSLNVIGPLTATVIYSPAINLFNYYNFI